MAGLSLYPGALDSSNSNIRTDIIDRSARTSSTDAEDYTLKASDVIVLQDAIVAIETELGIDPSGAGYADVAARILDAIDLATGDARYGGTGWSAAGSPTILNHTHTSNQINLATDVTGTLPASAINGVISGTYLAGDVLYLFDGSSDTITSELSAKLDTDGGTISGDVAVTGTFNSTTMIELDAYTTGGGPTGVGNNVTDGATFSGTARKGIQADLGGTLLTTTNVMRFLTYTLNLRSKVSDITQTDSIGVLTVTSGATTVLTYVIYPTIFDSNDTYKDLTIPFTHTSDGSGSHTNLNVEIEWYGQDKPDGSPVACSFSIDSVVISPINNAKYWQII